MYFRNFRSGRTRTRDNRLSVFIAAVSAAVAIVFFMQSEVLFATAVINKLIHECKITLDIADTVVEPKGRASWAKQYDGMMMCNSKHFQPKILV